MKRECLFFLLVLCVMPTLFAQTTSNANSEKKQPKIVTGRIVDEKGEPLPGATVWLKETSVGTVADENGQYSINVSTSTAPVLTVSFLGYSSIEEVVNGRNSVNFSFLPQVSQKVDEVVVVAYGSQKKESVIGAITTTKPTELRTPVASLSTALAGQIAGVVSVQRSGEPGSTSQFWIRGVSTLNSSSNKPLILVDGVERSIDLVDVEDIESFSVLKDATATAVYGVRGANGVVVITTRRGQTGAPKITVRAETGLVAPTQLPKMGNAQQFIDLFNEIYSYNGAPKYIPDEKRDMYLNGKDPDLYPNVGSWVDQLYKKVAQNYRVNANISGGGSIARYYVSGSFYSEGSIFNEDNTKKYDTSINYNKFNFRSNIDINITPTTVINANLSTIFETKITPGTDVSRIWTTSFTTTPIAFPVKYSDGSFSGASNGGKNPYNLLTQSGFKKYFWNNPQALIGITQDLADLVTPGLKVNVKFSWDATTSQNQSFNGSPNTYQATGRDADGNLIYQQVDVGTNTLSYERGSAANRTTYLEASAVYNRLFKNVHRVGGLLLYNQTERVDMFAGNINDAIPYRNQGIAGRGTYAYNDRYFAEVNIGYNGSENFSPGKRFGFFPAGALGWMISNEKFFQPLTHIVDGFKIRGSYGIVGNDNIGANKRFIYNGTFNTSNNAYWFGETKTGYAKVSVGDLANPSVSWEKSYKLDVGIELSLFKALKIQVDYFRDHRKGIFLLRDNLSDISGIVNMPYVNIGEVLNRGFDGLLEYNKRIGEVDLSVRANFTFNRNKTLVNSEPDPAYPYMSKIGLPVGQPFGYIALGLFETQEEADNAIPQFGKLRAGDVRYKDVNDDGVINAYDRVPIGYSWLPEISYGFGASMQWKGLNLSFLFQGNAHSSMMLEGNSVYAYAQNDITIAGLYDEIYRNIWTVDNPNPNAKYPRGTIGINTNNNVPSTIWQRDVSFLRLKSASIGYTLPKKFTNRLMLSSLQIYCNGLNLLTFTPFKMFDPEIDDQQGAKYPPVRSVSFGINVGF